MANEEMFQVGVKALISNSKGEVLVLKVDTSNHIPNTTPPYWDIPGGRMQKGEAILDTLAREVAEEVGVMSYARPPELLTTVVSRYPIPINDSLTVSLLLVVYRVVINEEAEIVLSQEHTDYEWVNSVDAATRLSGKYPAEFTSLL
jgi:8-oxo-dGTP pyrophosphatase MutT (NUDIX family)